MVKKAPLSVRLSNDNRTASIKLPGYVLKPGSVKRTVSVDELIPGYIGPIINIDLDADGRATGIEILVLESHLVP